LRVRFDSRLKLKFVGSKVTTDAGVLAYRELDEALGLTEMGADLLTDSRLGSNKQHQFVSLLRQSIYSRLAGYEDVNDAERLCVDPASRHVVGGRAMLPEKQAASSSEVGRFETETLSERRNLRALMKLCSQWIDKVHRRQPLQQLILDMDSSVSETYGQQQGTAYNGHFECLRQRSRYGRAVDKRRQERRQVDQALLPHVQRQPGPLAVIRLGLHPRQLPAATGPAETGATLVADDAPGEADQDRGQGNAALEVRDVPTG